MAYDPISLRFERFSLDLKRGCLHVGDAEVELRPKSFLVLQCLAENAGVLISKETLFQAVWKQRVVGDDSLVQCIRELREKLGDNDHRLIKTVPKRGYLLDAERLSIDVPTLAMEATPAEIGASITPAVPAVGPAGRMSFRDRYLRRPVAAWSVLLLAVGVALAFAIGLVGDWRFDQAGPVLAAQQQRTPFKHCADCPEMIALSTGEYLMGSGADERGRLNDEANLRAVRIAKPFAIGRYEVTVEQFEIFLKDTGLAVDNNCRVLTGSRDFSAIFGEPHTSFRAPSHATTAAHPVGCIGWHDAQAYVAWLQRKTGKPYRLPSEAEWEYAARAGTRTAYSFGPDASQLCEYARFADLDSAFTWRSACRSGVTTRGPLPIGSLKPNGWGLSDMHGNVWEWTEDCWGVRAAEVPVDGSPFVRPGNCEVGVVRGGSWVTGSTHTRSAMRMPMPLNIRNENVGFRVSLSLDEPKRVLAGSR
jgi:formylglycine-generating enzyme required for sulfatase activity